jgi:hypothetical protein
MFAAIRRASSQAARLDVARGLRTPGLLLAYRASRRRRRKMLKTLVAAVVLTGLVTPALAEYWVVKDDPSARKCSIVEEKPGKNKIVLTSEPTLQEAQFFINSQRACGGSAE